MGIHWECEQMNRELKWSIFFKFDPNCWALPLLIAWDKSHVYRYGAIYILCFVISIQRAYEEDK